MRPHKPKHWIVKAWARVCTSASVARSINPTLWAIIDVLLVAFCFWTIIQELLDPKTTPKVPATIRDKARRLLRHYPLTSSIITKEAHT